MFSPDAHNAAVSCSPASSELFEMPPLVDTRLHVHGQGRVLVGVRPGDAIEDVKAKIHNQWGVSPNAQHLFFKGKPLREPLDSSREPHAMGRAVAVLLVLCALLGAATMALLSITVPVTARVVLGNNGDDGDAHDARARTRKDGDSDTTSGRIVSPFDVYEKLSSYFGSEAWALIALKQQANEKPISRMMTVQWVGPGDIKPPRREKQFEAIEDINATYQCMAIKADQVATRQHSCWCTGCIHQAQVGADNAFLNADFLVSDCKPAMTGVVRRAASS